MVEPSKNGLFGNFLWSAIRIWGNRLGGLAIFFIMARILSPKDFGIYSAVWAVILFLEVFAEQGFADALIQKDSLSDRLLNTAFLINFLISIVIVLLVWLSSASIANWMKMPEISGPLQICALALVFNALGFCQLALCRRHFEYKWLAMRTLIATLTSGVTGIVLAVNGFGVWSLIVQYILSAFVNMALLWLKPNWIPSFNFSVKEVSELIRYSSKLMFSRLLEASSTRLFELLIGAWMGAVTLGIYAIGSRIYTIVMQLLSSCVVDVTHSEFSRLVNDKTALTNSYYKALLLTCALSFPVFLMITTSAYEVCVVVFGAKWGESAYSLQVLSILGAIQSIQNVNASVLNATGYTGQTLWLSILKAVFMAMAVMLYGHSDLNQLVLAYATGQGLLIPFVSFLLCKPKLELSWLDLLKKISPFVFSAFAAMLITWEIAASVNLSGTFLALVIKSLSFTIIYVLFVLSLSPHMRGIVKSKLLTSK